MSVLNRYHFGSCAVVGNSGQLLNASFGSAVDSHDLIMRVNQAPGGTKENRLERHVGKRTTFRLINTRYLPTLPSAPLLTTWGRNHNPTT